MSNFKPVSNDLLHNEVINAIIKAIACGEIRPGERIIEQNIAEQMQISRAPVREAIRELSAQDILEVTPRKGAYVAEVTVKSIEEAYSLRSVLEGMAVELSIKNLTTKEVEHLENLSKKMTEKLKENKIDDFMNYDVEFHSIINEKCNHLKLEKTIANLRLQTKLYMAMSKWQLLNNSALEMEYHAHDDIVDALKAKDGRKAKFEMEKHINFAGNTLIEILKKIKPREVAL